MTNTWENGRRRGFTLLEVIVAVMVFGVAIAGLFPLLVILSRDLQPLETLAADGSVTYRCTTPARDGSTTGVNLIYAQHTWYLTPFDQPWARKLGAGARIASDNGTFTSASPVSPNLPVFSHDDDELGNGTGDYTQTGNWTLGATGSLIPDRATYQYCPSLPEGQTPGYAYWTFTVPTAAWYVAEATWPTNIGLSVSSDSQFGIAINGAQPIQAVINQQNAPNSEQDAAGTWWQKVAAPIYIAANSCVTVSLNAPSGETTCVVADGVRLVGIANDVTVNGPVVRSFSTVNGNSNNEDATVQITVTVNLPPTP